jgi:hypothetical protein
MLLRPIDGSLVRGCNLESAKRQGASGAIKGRFRKMTVVEATSRRVVCGCGVTLVPSLDIMSRVAAQRDARRWWMRRTVGPGSDKGTAAAAAPAVSGSGSARVNRRDVRDCCA